MTTVTVTLRPLGRGGWAPITLTYDPRVRADGKHTPAQAAFLASWQGGPVVTIRDVAGALTVARMPLNEKEST